MGGIRIGGKAFIVQCSPPFSAFEGTDGDGDPNVYRACTGDAAGLATLYTSFNDGGVTTDGIHNPVLSPDETQILFELSNPNTGYTEIWVVANTPGSTATQLLADASNYIFHPSWHPDSDQFTYMHGTGGSLITAGGGGVKKSSVSAPGSTTLLKSAGGGFSPFRPAFNFDGSRIAYIYDQDVGGTGDLRVMDADGTNDAAVDNAVKYRFQGPQFSWAHSSSVLAYDDGATGANAAYVINDDGTGQTQINANGDAAGATVRISDRAWPPADDYVVMGCQVINTLHMPVRGELDGSGSTTLNASHGGWGQDYFRQVLVADGRIWWIESSTTLGSVLIDGTDWRTDLVIDGAAMGDFSSGDGWFFD